MASVGKCAKMATQSASLFRRIVAPTSTALSSSSGAFLTQQQPSRGLSGD